MKILNYVLAALFVTFAVVQYNDPDPWKWIFLYLIVAAISFSAALGKYNKWALLIGLAIFAVEAFRIYPEFQNWINDGMPSIVDSMQAESPHIEFVREFLGLILCFLVLFFHYFQFRKSQIKNV
jgi:MFS family permease